MVKLSFRIIMALLIASLIWWIGPLISIGQFLPLGSALLRTVLVYIVLIWGGWPLLVRLWIWLAISVRQTKTPTKNPINQTMLRRLKEIDAAVKKRWLSIPRSKWSKRIGILGKTYRNEYSWFLVVGGESLLKSDIQYTLVNHPTNAQTKSYFTPLDHIYSNQSADGGLTYLSTADATWLNTNESVTEPVEFDHANLTQWSQLLQGMYKLRGQEGFNGVMLSIDLPHIYSMGIDQRKNLIEGYRRRLVEIKEVLGRIPPVYVALTGLEKIPGGQILMNFMSEDELAYGVGFQIKALGFNNVEDLYNGLQDEFILLETGIQKHTLFNLKEIQQTNQQNELLKWVEFFAEIRPILANLIASICFEDAYVPVGYIRSVWIGSAKQTHEALKYNSEDDAFHATNQAKLLWGGVVEHMIKERFSHSRNGALSEKHRRRQFVKRGLVMGSVFLCLGWFLFSYLKDSSIIDNTWAKFNRGTQMAEQEAGQTNTPVLLRISSQMQYANILQRNGVNITPYFEVFRVERAVSTTYKKHLQKTFFPEFYNTVQSKLVEQINAKTGDTYQTLKIYLMMGKPEKRNAKDAEQWVRDNWQSISNGQFTDEDLQVLIGHVGTLFNLPDTQATPIDNDLVLNARAAAANIPSITRVLSRIMSQPLPPNVPSVSLSTAAGVNSAVALRMRSGLAATDVAIPGWYTREGYQDVFKPMLSTASREVLEEESWVLRDSKLDHNSFEIEKMVEQLADATKNQFLQDYVRHWQNFLKDVTIRSTTGLDDAAVLASTFVEPSSPLANLVRFAGRATTLTGTDENGVDSWIDRQKIKIEQGKRAVVGEVSGERMRNQMRPEFLVENNFAVLRNMAKQLETGDAKSPSPLSRLFESISTQLGLVNGAMQSGQIIPQYDAFARLRTESARQPEPIRGIVMDLLDSSSASVSKQSKDILESLTMGTIDSACQSYGGLYPFNRNIKTEMALSDFEQQFGASGVLASQFKEQIQPYVDTSSSPWRPKAIKSSNGALVNGETVARYETAQAIRESMLDSAGKLKLSNIIQVVDMDPQLAEVKIEFGGKSLFYAHGVTSPQRIDWTGESVLIRVKLRSIDGKADVLEYSGPWALFKFYDAGVVAVHSADKQEVTYKTRMGTVRTEWQSLVRTSPLWSDVLNKFKC